LSLSGMNIRALAPDVLSNLPDLQWLDLRSNQLQQLPPGVLSNLTSLRSHVWLYVMNVCVHCCVCLNPEPHPNISSPAQKETVFYIPGKQKFILYSHVYLYLLLTILLCLRYLFLGNNLGLSCLPMELQQFKDLYQYDGYDKPFAADFPNRFPC
jgi:hypothetical protein